MRISLKISCITRTSNRRFYGFWRRTVWKRIKRGLRAKCCRRERTTRGLKRGPWKKGKEVTCRGARKSFGGEKRRLPRFAFKGERTHWSHDLGSLKRRDAFHPSNNAHSWARNFVSWQIGLRTIDRIRTHGCVYSFRLGACIWKRRRCRMRHVRVHVSDLCKPRPLTSRLLADASTFDTSMLDLKPCSRLRSLKFGKLISDRS